MTEIDYEARVAKGIALLDEQYPDWATVINLDTLDVGNSTCCVTAQLAQHCGDDVGADYRDGMLLLGLKEGTRCDGSYTQHGFNAETRTAPGMPSHYRQGDAYTTLNTIWKREILARRSEA